MGFLEFDKKEISSRSMRFLSLFRNKVKLAINKVISIYSFQLFIFYHIRPKLSSQHRKEKSISLFQLFYGQFYKNNSHPESIIPLHLNIS